MRGSRFHGMLQGCFIKATEFATCGAASSQSGLGHRFGIASQRRFAFSVSRSGSSSQGDGVAKRSRRAAPAASTSSSAEGVTEVSTWMNLEGEVIELVVEEAPPAALSEGGPKRASSNSGSTGGKGQGSNPAAGAGAGGGGGGGAGVVEVAEAKEFEDVTTVDSFSRGRVFNFLGRGQEAPTSTSNALATSSGARPNPAGRTAAGLPTTSDGSTGSLQGSAPKFETTTTRVRNITVYHTRLRLPLPAPHGVKVAEGVAESAKDSEVLCTMHAERIIDSRGLKLYRLPRMQEKYANQVRAEGRWAPLPTDPERDVMEADAHSPLPLRMVSAELMTAMDGTHHTTAAEPEPTSKSTQSVTSTRGGGGAGTGLGGQANAVGAQGPPTKEGTVFYDPTEGSRYQLVNINSFRFSPTDTTLQYPYVFDKRSLKRVKEWVVYHRSNGGATSAAAAASLFDQSLKISHVADPGGTGKRHYMVELPLAPVSPTTIARGKSEDRSYAIMLAAMHAELLLNALGIPIYPNDAELQALHQKESESYGRPFGKRVLPSQVPDGQSTFDAEGLPLPLKQMPEEDYTGLSVVEASTTRYRNNRAASESLVVMHNEWADRLTGFVSVNPDPSILEEARVLLEQLKERTMGVLADKRHNGFVYTQMGDYYRATTLLPVPFHRSQLQYEDDSSASSSFSHWAPFPIGGVGIGRSVEQARDLASLHALEVLHAFGFDLHPGGEQGNEQKEFESKLAAWNLLVPRELNEKGFPIQNAEPDHGSATTPSDSLAAPTKGPKLHPGTVPPPGYQVEGPERALADAADVRWVSRMQIGEFRAIDKTAEEILNESVELKAMIQGYVRRTEGTGQDLFPNIFTSTRGTSPSGKARSVAYNIVFLPIFLPDGRRFLARGISLKKKDAERCCFIHAKNILDFFGVNPMKQKGSKGKAGQPLAKAMNNKQSVDRFTKSDPWTQATSEEASSTATIEIDIDSTDSATELPTEEAQIPGFPPPLRHPLLTDHISTLEKQQAEAARLAAAQASAWVPRSGQ
jgi:hypothetical protein